MLEVSDSQLNTKQYPDLYRKTVQGGYWIVILRIAIQILGLIKSLIIANFFLLENLGIISIALLMMDVMATFTQTGFDSALIQKKTHIDGYLNTAWTTGLMKGAILCLILFLCAPILASIRVPEDKIPLAISVIRAMSICFFIRGMRNIGTIYFDKELEFRKVFAMTFSSSLADIVLSITFVFVFRSIWGVILARIISEGIFCAAGYLLSPYRPRFHFEWKKARELWRFGKWIYGQGILGYFLEMGDNFFVWFYLGLPQLALYKYAYNFSSLPATHITQVSSTVSFPAYSKIQDDVPRLRDAYLKILKVTAFFAIPVSFQIFILGPDFVKLFLKEHLHPMTTALQILAIKGLLMSTGSTRGPLFMAMGKPYVTWHLQWIRLAILAITIYPLTCLWGIVGTAVSTVLVSLLIKPFGFVIAHRILQCSFMEHIRPSFCPLIASSIMAASIAGFRLLSNSIGYIQFAFHVVVGLAVYLVCIFALDRATHYGFSDLVREQIQWFRKSLRK